MPTDTPRFRATELTDFAERLFLAAGCEADKAGAIAAYQKAIALKPDCAEAFSNLGLALQRKGRLDEAIVQYRSALRLAA